MVLSNNVRIIESPNRKRLALSTEIPRDRTSIKLPRVFPRIQLPGEVPHEPGCQVRSLVNNKTTD